jgi:hypothetical protein
MMHETPYAFSDEVLNGFKNKFGKFFGTDHLVREGWLSYQKSMPRVRRCDGAPEQAANRLRRDAARR